MNEPFDPELRPALRLALLLVSGALTCLLTASDDGLRHVGLAFGAPRNWGDVYPLSGLTLARDFNPWMGYDLTLRAVASLVRGLPLSPVAARLLVLKLVTLVFIAGLLLLCARRARVAEALRKPSDLIVALALMAVALELTVGRAACARPFMFGSLFLIYSIGRRGFVHGLCAALVPLWMYPHLGFVFTGPAAIAHFFRGDRRYAYGTALATVGSVALLPPGFWSLFAELLHADSVRARLRPKITELAPAWEHLGLVAVLLLVLAVLVPRTPPTAPRLRFEHVIMLLFLPVSLKYARFIPDVLLPLAFVAHGGQAITLCSTAVASLGERWRRFLGLSGRSSPGATEHAPGAPRTRARLLIAVSSALCLFAISSELTRQRDEFTRAQPLLAVVPRDTRVLTEFNLQYQTLFLRPDLSVIPSCELGIPARSIEEPYAGFWNHGGVCTLARATQARYYLEERRTYLDPRDTQCLALVTEDERLRVWRIDP